MYFLRHTTICPVILPFALVAFSLICRALSWFVNSSTKFAFPSIHVLSWSLLIFFLLSIMRSSFLYLCFLSFLISTHFFLIVHLFQLHLCVFFSSAYVDCFLQYRLYPLSSVEHLWFCLIWFHPLLYTGTSSNVDLQITYSHVLSSVMNWSNVS